MIEGTRRAIDGHDTPVRRHNGDGRERYPRYEHEVEVKVPATKAEACGGGFLVQVQVAGG